jgi:methanogenic corrinoid protein MtbC1
MSSSGTFAATILETGSGAFAGYAASLLLERDAELAARYGASPLGHWRAGLNQRVLELAAAVRAGEPAVFAGRVDWARRALAARDLPEQDIRAGLECLATALRERLPAPALAPVEACLAAALEVFERPPLAQDSDLDPTEPHGRLALEYLTLALEGNAPAAVARLIAAVDEGMALAAVYEHALIGAEREIGRLWHAGKASIAEEHLVTATTRRAMAALATRAEPAPANGKTVAVASVAGNAHELGVRMLADFFEFDGWRVIFLGTDLPAGDLARGVHYFNADLLVLSATLAPQLAAVEEVIGRVRAESDTPAAVMVGGLAFADAPELWRRMGADATAANVADALARARELVGA